MIHFVFSNFLYSNQSIYENGLVRFAANSYSSLKKTAKNRFVHLTNYSISKKKKKNDESQETLVEEEKFSTKDSKW